MLNNLAKHHIKHMKMCWLLKLRFSHQVTWSPILPGNRPKPNTREKLKWWCLLEKKCQTICFCCIDLKPRCQDHHKAPAITWESWLTAFQLYYNGGNPIAKTKPLQGTENRHSTNFYWQLLFIAFNKLVPASACIKINDGSCDKWLNQMGKCSLTELSQKLRAQGGNNRHRSWNIFSINQAQSLQCHLQLHLVGQVQVWTADAMGTGHLWRFSIWATRRHSLKQ